ncbi:hypothetical protein [Anabaena sp. PCC 7108]|uniref:hypothetical protein n=1 Tax=Anabaena sp. PCC 7108 TaxID=163908 RepID=UPI00034D66C2|nr:hypothetical protein [Anabaena sp. PCC 7108]
MLILKQVPWFSLSLVLLSYSTLGWVISATKAPWFVWLIVISAILVLLVSLTTPWSKLTEYYNTLFQSNARSFGVAVLAALLFFIMIAWFRIFLDTLLMLSATILVKIDFQAAGFQESIAFWLTCIFSLTGLSLGVLFDRLI